MRRRVAVTSGVAALVIVSLTGITVFLGDHKHSNNVFLTNTPPSGVARSQVPQQLSLQDRERSVSAPNARKYFTIPVTAEDGTHETVGVKRQPVIFIADWYTKVLHQLSGQKFPAKPILIAVDPKPGETHSQEISEINQDEKAAGLSFKVVALDAAHSNQWISGVPDTYVWMHGKVTEIPGILPPSNKTEWSTLLN